MTAYVRTPGGVAPVVIAVWLAAHRTHPQRGLETPPRPLKLFAAPATGRHELFCLPCLEWLETDQIPADADA